MTISVVTLSYNQAPFLNEAMDSVLGQGYPELEYIVVDPGSTDGSRDIIARRAAELGAMILEPDQGAADGLNKGFARATGEVYGFLNADDVLYPGSLAKVSRFFTENPDCDVVFGGGHKIDGRGRRLHHFQADGFTVNRYLYGGAVWLQQSTFFRAEAFRRSPGFNIQNRTCWDGELIVGMIHAGARAGYIRSDLAGFRIHESSISGSGRLTDMYLRDCARIFRDIRGREWNQMDHLRRLYYRGTAHLLRSLQALMNTNEDRS